MLVARRRSMDEKSSHEMKWWRDRKAVEGMLNNSHYEYFFTAHFELEKDFYSGKKVLDIGCGPRGSLEWADKTSERVGLDTLADFYRELGTEKHKMKYCAAPSEDIPFPDEYFDLVSSFNSLDHVDDLDKTIANIKRVLKPGGAFILLVEVNHKPTMCEPIFFSWDIIDKFSDCLTPVDVRHYEKTGWGMYDSIRNNVPYDDNNASNRYGILSARFVKKEGRLTYPFVSIVVPVYNAEATLSLCLESIQAIDYPKDKFEVLVVDNGSTDNSIQIARKFGATVLFETSIKSSYAARNKGIAAAKGDLIAFTDADCIVTPTWLKHLVKEWDDESIGCFAGEIEAHQPRNFIEIFSDRQGMLRQKGTLSCTYLPYTQTANSAYRRDVFEKVGLFIPEMTSGGDGEISWRMQKQLGLGIKFIPEALVYHKHRTSLTGLYRQFQKYERGKLLWHKHYPDYELPSVNQRAKELIDAIGRAVTALPANSAKLLARKIDLVDFLTPWFIVTTRLATYRARVEKFPLAFLIKALIPGKA